MKTKDGEHRYTIFIVVVAIIIASVLLVRLLSTRTGEVPMMTKQPEASPTAATKAPSTDEPAQPTPTKGNLMAWADDETDAEKIASLYGITLLSYSDHIAVYWTDQNPADVIQLGKTNGWPELSKINTVNIF